jgi:hypothetical protein
MPLGRDPVSAQDILNAAAAEHGTAAAGNPTHLLMGGKYVATSTALSDGDAGVIALSAHGEVRPMGVGGQATHFNGVGTNSNTVLKASAGNIYFIYASNPTTSHAHLQLFDLADGDTTLNVTAPKLSFFIEAGVATSGKHIELHFNPPIKFNTAITYAFTLEGTGSTTLIGTGRALLNVIYD